jgi:hypothetical protein
MILKSLHLIGNIRQIFLQIRLLSERVERHFNNGEKSTLLPPFLRGLLNK